MPETKPDHEPVYDAEINPLMARIIEICKRDSIPMLASFWLRNDDDGPLRCTTYAPGDPVLADALRVVRPQPLFAAFTIHTAAKP